MKVALWAVILSLNSMVGVTEEVKPTEATRGCLMQFCDISGGGSIKYFVKVADDEYDDPDTGKAQIWGINPNNKHYDSRGHLMFERAFAEDFIKAGGYGRKEGTPCQYHCPLW